MEHPLPNGVTRIIKPAVLIRRVDSEFAQFWIIYIFDILFQKGGLYLSLSMENRTSRVEVGEAPAGAIGRKL